MKTAVLATSTGNCGYAFEAEAVGEYVNIAIKTMRFRPGNKAINAMFMVLTPEQSRKMAHAMLHYADVAEENIPR